MSGPLIAPASYAQERIWLDSQMDPDAPVYTIVTGLDLPAAGTYPLTGYDALRFLRSRSGVGDGSDLTRISSQQVYLAALVRKLKSSETLSDPSKVLSLDPSTTTTSKCCSRLMLVPKSSNLGSRNS